ncbi:hypothetical protein CBER1_10990 [Cercospora berteroae]|uniref:Uncharacterized protein n=1 Tax=Cercospora berteroae TaxID=357750 RepID=A0A2S6BXC3_9PEZI|nr:hypothetical protein CBER1_10990 [Cercospora berteroae]
MRCQSLESNTVPHQLAPGQEVIFEFEAEIDANEFNSVSEWALVCPKNEFPEQIFRCRIEGVGLQFSPKAPWSSSDVSMSTLFQSYASLEPDSYLSISTRYPSRVIERALQLQCSVQPIEAELVVQGMSTNANAVDKFNFVLEVYSFARAFRLHPAADGLMSVLWSRASRFEHLLRLNGLHYAGDLTMTPYDNRPPEDEPEQVIDKLQKVTNLGLFVFLFDQRCKRVYPWPGATDDTCELEEKDRLWFLVRPDRGDGFHRMLLAALQKIGVIDVQAVEIIASGGYHMLTPETESIETYSRYRKLGEPWPLPEYESFDGDVDDVFHYENIVAMEPVLFAVTAKFWEPVDLLEIVLESVEALMA